MTACWQLWLKKKEPPRLAGAIAACTALAVHAGHHEIWDLFSSTNVGSVLLSVCVLPPESDSSKPGQQELQEAVSESESDATADAVQATAGETCFLPTKIFMNAACLARSSWALLKHSHEPG